MRVDVQSYSNLGASWGWVVSAAPRPLYPQKRDPVPFVSEAGWASGPVWMNAERLGPTWIRPPDRTTRSQSLYRRSSPGTRKIQQQEENGKFQLNNPSIQQRDSHPRSVLFSSSRMLQCVRQATQCILSPTTNVPAVKLCSSGAFAKLQERLLVASCLFVHRQSICLSVHMELLAFHWTDFHGI